MIPFGDYTSRGGKSFSHFDRWWIPHLPPSIVEEDSALGVSLTRPVQSMLHQENPSVVINTGSKQGITNPP